MNISMRSTKVHRGTLFNLFLRFQVGELEETGLTVQRNGGYFGGIVSEETSGCCEASMEHDMKDSTEVV